MRSSPNFPFNGCCSSSTTSPGSFTSGQNQGILPLMKSFSTIFETAVSSISPPFRSFPPFLAKSSRNLAGSLFHPLMPYVRSRWCCLQRSRTAWMCISGLPTRSTRTTPRSRMSVSVSSGLGGHTPGQSMR